MSTGFVLILFTISELHGSPNSSLYTYALCKAESVKENYGKTGGVSGFSCSALLYPTSPSL